MLHFVAFISIVSNFLPWVENFKSEKWLAFPRSFLTANISRKKCRRLTNKRFFYVKQMHFILTESHFSAKYQQWPSTAAPAFLYKIHLIQNILQINSVFKPTLFSGNCLQNILSKSKVTTIKYILIVFFHNLSSFKCIKL